MRLLTRGVSVACSLRINVHKDRVLTLVAVLSIAALVAAVPWHACAAPALTDTVPCVLTLDSSRHGYHWSDQEIRGFVEQTREMYPHLDPPIEHLDTWRHLGKNHEALTKDLIKRKYAGHRIDAIAAFDNAAVHLFIQNRHDLFTGIPIVFAGVNDPSPQTLHGQPAVTAVAVLAPSVITGERPASIRVDTTDGTKPMFGHAQLQSFKIPLAELPAGSVSVNQPVSSVERYRTLTIGTLTVVATLSVLVIALAASLFRLLRTQKELKKSEGDYRRIVETANEGVCAMGADYRTTFVNPRLVDMLGYSMDELIGMRVDSFMFEEDLADHALQMEIRQTGGPSVYERRFAKKDGRTLWTRVSATAVMGADGEFLGSVAMLTDITDRKAMDDELKESEKLYKSLFEQTRRQEELHRSLLNCSADPIVVYDMEGRVQYLNPAHTDLFGWDLEEVRGRRLNTVPEEDRSASFAIIDDILTRGAVHKSYDTKRLTKDGRLVDVSVSGARYLDHEGNPAGLLVIIRDISDRKKVEESLRQSEERFRLAFENANIGVCIVAPDGILLRANDRMCEMLGYSCTQLEGMPVTDIAHAEDSKLTSRFIERACAGEAARGVFEKRYLHRLGHVVEGRESNSLVTDGQGKPLYFISHVLDITERKIAERALKESERRLATLMSNLPGMAYSCSSDRMRTMHFISEGCLALTGYVPGDLVGNRIARYSDLIHPEDRERVWWQVQEALSANKSFELEYRIMTQSGEEKWVWERGIAVPAQSKEEVNVEGFIADITERKHMEHALQESEQRYRAVVENLQIGIAVINPHLEIVAINRFLQNLYPPLRPGLKQPCYERCSDPPRTTPCEACPCLRTFADGKVHESVIEMFVGDRMLSFRVVSCPIMDARGQVEFAIELVEDITETKALQMQLAQSQKLQAVGTLAGGIAHDFNNLLQVVLGYADLLLTDERFPNVFRDDLRKVYQAAQNGADLVKRLLTFSRKTRYNPMPVNLNQRIEQLQKMIKRTIPKMISIEMALAPHVAPINADPNQIDQILMNLALNSRDAMPDGGRLFIETGNTVLDEHYCRSNPEATTGPHVLLSVSDTGQGMGRETLEHIFEPFYTTKETGKGTGLGLAVVYGIVRQHAGHIKCYSEPGLGTTFKIYFPALTSCEGSEQPGARPSPLGGSKSILLVDDEPMVSDLCARVLVKSGYEVITAANGKEALELYAKRQQDITLVILDLIMPEMGGKQCLEGLLKIDPSVKVVIASGYSADMATEDVLERGAKAFVTKPYDTRHVLKVISEVLNAP
jgi:two-component system, cell cycle sensor histidine kinase and response regulator CckA